MVRQYRGYLTLSGPNAARTAVENFLNHQGKRYVVPEDMHRFEHCIWAEQHWLDADQSECGVVYP